jgi:AP-3 complex subunit delta-1
VKYVALLAFNKIVDTHPWLVAQQEDVILECIDSADISIRIKALDLVQGMVNNDNLVSIVSRLMRQLKLSSTIDDKNGVNTSSSYPGNSDDDDLERTINPTQKATEQVPPLPDDYRVDVINRILNMCSQNNYSYLNDFEWYIDILTQLVRIAPTPRKTNDTESHAVAGRSAFGDISEKVGNELRNVAVKVQAVRPACLQAAEIISSQLRKDTSTGHPLNSGALGPVAWVIGEYATELEAPDETLGLLLQLIPKITSPEPLAASLQATMKVFSLAAGDQLTRWSAEHKSKILLLMAHIVHTFEALTLHPNLEVQERAVEFTELLKLTAEAASAQETSTEMIHQDTPLLLTQAIPSLFAGWDLKSVAASAQKNVPLPEGLDLDEPINPNLNSLLASAESTSIPVDEADEFDTYYYQRPPATSVASEPAITRLADERHDSVGSYQRPTEESYLDADIVARRKVERQEKNRDDPFYIQETGSLQRSSTPIHNILQNSNGPDLDVDSIPIMELDLGKLSAGMSHAPMKVSKPSRSKPRQQIVIAADENLGSSGQSTPKNDSENESGSLTSKAARARRLKQSLLGVDSTNIVSLSLEGGPDMGAYDPAAQQREDAEMAQAVKEVERLRLEMQRANERIQVAQGVDAAGTVVKKKKKTTSSKTKKKAVTAADEEAGEGGAEGVKVVKKKKKKEKVAAIDEGSGGPEQAVVKPQNKKVKLPAESEEMA